MHALTQPFPPWLNTPTALPALIDDIISLQDCSRTFATVSNAIANQCKVSAVMRSSSLGRLSQGLVTFGIRTFSGTAAQQSPTAKKAGLSTAAKFGIAVPAVGIGAWVISSKDPGTRAAIAFQLPVRFARDVICAGLIAAGRLLASWIYHNNDHCVTHYSAFCSCVRLFYACLF